MFATTLTWYYKYYFTQDAIQKFLSDALRRSLKMTSISDIAKESSLQSIDVVDKRVEKMTEEEAYAGKVRRQQDIGKTVTRRKVNMALVCGRSTRSSKEGLKGVETSTK